MTFPDRVRKWLRLDDVASMAQLQAFELREKQRHKAAHNVQMGMLNRIEQRLINEHIGQNRMTQEFAPAILDWDTVQALALQDLERNPEKEH